jgi:alkanesulfonate monooxygenase SsuD/methylene tetrahydromethanopterin reductase-like flavin-dependent oxidoreductase (luciferase family)
MANLLCGTARLRRCTRNDKMRRHLKGAPLCGTPDQVVDRLRHMKEALGHGVMNINMKIGNIPDEVVRRSMQLWGERVVPHVHNL